VVEGCGKDRRGGFVEQCKIVGLLVIVLECLLLRLVDSMRAFQKVISEGSSKPTTFYYP